MNKYSGSALNSISAPQNYSPDDRTPAEKVINQQPRGGRFKRQQTMNQLFDKSVRNRAVMFATSQDDRQIIKLQRMKAANDDTASHYSPNSDELSNPLKSAERVRTQSPVL
jgi:hypothetical protein